MATVAGNFLSINIATIVSTMQISESLAGVTISAFGNGSSDLFSTLAAMKANSGSLAINELFSAAAFITTVVLGCVIYTQPLVLETKAFAKDVVWFLIAASSLVAFLEDGQLVMGDVWGLLLCMQCLFFIRCCSRATITRR
jgi:solute carrier family 24 (sodium/potassium/calcium exchanger), member 6